MDYKKAYEEIKDVMDKYYGTESEDDCMDGDGYMETIGAIIDAAKVHENEVKELEKLGLERFVNFLNENVAGIRIKVELVDEFLGQ